MSDNLLVITTLSDPATAEQLAERIVEAGLAACVNIGAPMTSIYRWEGKLQRGTEVMLSIKTSRQRYPQLQAAIVKDHPYELPEVIAVPIAEGLPDYLAWIQACTSS